MQVSKSGVCKIVSSGYSDRFVQSSHEVTLIVKDILFKVSPDHAVAAIAHLRGLDRTDVEVMVNIAKELRAVPTKYIGTYKVKNEFGDATCHAIVNPNAVSAGINLALGFKGLSESGIASAKKVAENTSETEKEFIKYWLGKINDVHKANGKEVVEFYIPEV